MADIRESGRRKQMLGALAFLAGWAALGYGSGSWLAALGAVDPTPRDGRGVAAPGAPGAADGPGMVSPRRDDVAGAFAGDAGRAADPPPPDAVVEARAAQDAVGSPGPFLPRREDVVGVKSGNESHAADLPPTEEPFVVCGRVAQFHRASRPLPQTSCPKYKSRKTLLLTKKQPHGEAEERLRTFLRAAQFARDQRMPLAITADSWAAQALTTYFFMTGGDDWKSLMAESLCLRILEKKPKRSWKYRTVPPTVLFHYKSKAPKEERAASQLQLLRALFRHHNTGPGPHGAAVPDMCSGIDALFASPGDGAGTGRQEVTYSALHLRDLGRNRLRQACQGCDPVAAQEMRPAYVKAILGPLDMLTHPIVVLSDEHLGSEEVLQRLREDPQIGPRILVVPEAARWLGGDATLAVMVSTRRLARSLLACAPA